MDTDKMPRSFAEMDDEDIAYGIGMARQWLGLNVSRQLCGTGSFGSRMQTVCLMTKSEFIERYVHKVVRDWKKAYPELIKDGMTPYSMAGNVPGSASLLRTLLAYELAYGETIYGEPSDVLEIVYDDTRENYWQTRENLIEDMTGYDEEGELEINYNIEPYRMYNVNQKHQK